MKPMWQHLSMVVLWRDGPFSGVKGVAESIFELAEASKRLGGKTELRSFLCTLPSNSEPPEVQEWAASMKARCTGYGVRERERPVVDFKLVVAQQPISTHLHDIFRYVIGNIYIGGCLLVDIPLNRSLAEYCINELVTIQPLDCSLVCGESGKPKAIHLAYIPALDTYVRGGLLIFHERHYWRRHGLFRKPTFGINTLDDFASAMEVITGELRKSSGSPCWNVRRVKLP